MTRARETAAIIGHQVQQSEQEHYHRQTVVVTAPDPLLNEGLPAAIIPPRPDVGPVLAVAQQIDEHHHRLEAAFQKYIHRAASPPVGRGEPPPEDGVHEFEVIVGHANVIRYFFCRALQLPPEAWLRLSLFNCSVTYLMVQPNGYVTARLLGDTGHIPYEETTFSGAYGYNWKSPTST
jgi:serine/threonine-protein phosphatase PGAM5